MVRLFLDFMKGPPLQINAGEYAIKLPVLKLCLRDELESDTFRNRPVVKSWIFFKYLTPQIIRKEPGLLYGF